MTILHHRRYHHVDDLIGTPQEMKSGFTHFSSRRFIGMRGGGASGSKENSSSGKSAPATAAAKKSTPAPEAPPPPRPTLTIVTELESGSDKDEMWVNNNSILSMATSVPNPAYGGVLGASVPANTASILNCPNSEPSMPRLSATPIVPIAPIAEADQRMKVLQQLESKFGQDGKKPLPAASTAKHSAGASPAASSPSKSGADSTASKGGVLTSTIDTKKGAEKEKKSSGPKTVAQMRRERREQVLRVGVQRLQKRLGDLHLHLHNVRHDGNCQFRSIAYQLLGSEHYHDCIRSHVASYMRSRREKFDFYFDTKEKADAYYTGVAKGGTWGDELTLRAASDSLCLNIHVISSEEHHCYITYRPSPDAPPPPSFLVDMQSIQERHRAERKSQHLDAASPIFDATAIQQALQQRLTEADIFSTTPHFAAEGTAVQPAAEDNAEQAGNHMAKFVAAGAEVGGDGVAGGPEINNIIRRPVLPTVPSSNNTSSRAGRYGGPLFTANEGHVTLLASSYKSGSKSLRQSFAGLPSHCLDGASTSGVTANSFYNSSFSLAPGDCVAADGGSGPMTPSCGLNPIAMSSSVTGASEADLSGISGGAGTRFLFEARSEPVDVFLSYLCPVQYNAVVVEEFEDVLEAAQNQQQPSPGATVTPPHGVTPVGSSPRLATSAMAGPSPGQFVSVPFLRPPGNDSTSLET